MLGKDVPAPDDFAGSQETDSDDPEFVRIDQLYQQALKAMEAVESQDPFGAESAFLASSDSDQRNQQPESSDEPNSVIGDPEELKAEIGERRASDAASQPLVRLSALSSPPSAISPRQIIEAALFVGGRPLTSKALCALLRGDFDQAFVEAMIDELNSQYAAENRPYTIQFGEGGYRMTLRPEFQRLHHRLFGMGPKEIKLSQEALEMLALIAYQQPITRSQIEELGKPNAGGLLRRLLRRELIALKRDPDDPQTVSYHTTQRFLDLFGIGRLDELPQADELSFK